MFPTLTIRGRRSVEQRTVPIGPPLNHAGARYLVSGPGNTHWLRNLRASGQGVLRIGRIRETFRAMEVEGEDRARVVAAYRAKLGRAIKGYFNRIPNPADHPVLQTEPLPRSG